MQRFDYKTNDWQYTTTQTLQNKTTDNTHMPKHSQNLSTVHSDTAQIVRGAFCPPIIIFTPMIISELSQGNLVHLSTPLQPNLY